jgi:energy-coupling factor transport system permease protein
MLDARTWLIWALSTLVVASSTRNPLYGLLLLLATWAVYALCTPRDAQGSAFSPVRLASLVIPLAIVFNGLTNHLGDTILFRLPTWLPLLGGPVTLEALVFGAMNGLVLAAILSGFATINRTIPTRDLVRITPRAFHEAGVVLSIALTLIPQTRRSLAQIREAQAVRGHRVRGLGDWLPIVVPLLVNGMERSMGLAEAMVARGYGATDDRPNPRRLQALLSLGLLALLGGWGSWLFLPAWRGLSVVLMVAGAGLIGLAAWLAGRAVHHTSYRRHRWTIWDAVVLLGCAVTLAVVLLPLPGFDRTSLAYSPYPQIHLPSFDVAVGIGLLGLLAPIATAFGKTHYDHV